MKKQKSRGKRAAAAVLGILLVLTLLTSISAVTGNPLIAAIGACRAARYAAGTYGITDAAVSSGKKESVCSFTYWYTVASEHSPDTAFIVQVPLWGGNRDNYEYAETQLHNTRERLGRERAVCWLWLWFWAPIRPRNPGRKCSVCFVLRGSWP